MNPNKFTIVKDYNLIKVKKLLKPEAVTQQSFVSKVLSVPTSMIDTITYYLCCKKASPHITKDIYALYKKLPTVSDTKDSAAVKCQEAIDNLKASSNNLSLYKLDVGKIQDFIGFLQTIPSKISGIKAAAANNIETIYKDVKELLYLTQDVIQNVKTIGTALETIAKDINALKTNLKTKFEDKGEQLVYQAESEINSVLNLHDKNEINIDLAGNAYVDEN